MFNASVSSQVKVPAVVVGGKTKFGDSRFKNVETFFSLAASDDFADAHNKAVAGGNGFAVIIKSHIKSFDFFRIVGNENRLFENPFCQAAFVLCLQVAAPAYLIFEFAVIFFEQFYGFCISDSAEIGICNRCEPVDKSLINEFVEEFKLHRTVFKNVVNNVFDHTFGNVHVVAQFRKRHFGLNHPEFSCVTLGV